MKKLLSLLALIPSVLFIASCDPDTPNGGGDPKDKTDIHLIDMPTEFSVASDVDTVCLSFVVSLDNEDADWKVTASESWCKPEPAEGRF